MSWKNALGQSLPSPFKQWHERMEKYSLRGRPLLVNPNGGIPDVGPLVSLMVIIIVIIIMDHGF